MVASRFVLWYEAAFGSLPLGDPTRSDSLPPSARVTTTHLLVYPFHGVPT